MSWDTDLISTADISEDAATAYNLEQHTIKEALIERSQNVGPDPLDSLTAEQVRELHNRSVAEQAKRTEEQRQFDAARLSVQNTSRARSTTRVSWRGWKQRDWTGLLSIIFTTL